MQPSAQARQLASAKPQKLRHILIGCGRVAEKHLKALINNRDRYELLAVVDRNIESARKLISQHAVTQNCPVYADLAACLSEQEHIDSAAICTPSGSHYELARQLLEQNIHCLIEKPLTLDLAQARSLEALARQNHLRIALAYIYRYFPIIPALESDLAAGRYGRVLLARVEVFWSHDQAYYDQAGWRGTWAADGGVLMNQCVHALDLMFHLCNADPVSAQAQLYQQTHHMQAEDLACVQYRMRPLNCTDAEFPLQLTGTTSSAAHAKRAAFHLLCEKAEISCGLRRGRPYFELREHSGRSVRSGYYLRQWNTLRKRGLRQGIADLKNPHSGIYLDFAEAIHDAREPRSTAHDGCRSLAAVLSAYASAHAYGSVEPVPPPSFQIGDMEGFFPAN